MGSHSKAVLQAPLNNTHGMCVFCVSMLNGFEGIGASHHSCWILGRGVVDGLREGVCVCEVKDMDVEST